MNFYINLYDVDMHKYLIATYWLETSKDLAWAAWQLACGQSMGNPNVRNHWETEELYANHSALIIGEEEGLKRHQKGFVQIAFPLANFNITEDGLSQLLCVLIGGQCDIKGIDRCELRSISPLSNTFLSHMPLPKYGISGIRKFTEVENKPLLLGIVKPKIVNSAKIFTDMVTELIEGGCNLIKEDECMSSPSCLPFQERVKLVAPILKGTKVVFFHTLNSDYPYILDRAKYVADNGGNGIHINFWSGFGAYKAVRQLDLPLFMHGQTSSIKILSDEQHRYHINSTVIHQLMALAGCDTLHAGMMGGYGNYNENQTRISIEICRKFNCLPTLSCGFEPNLVEPIASLIGPDYAVGAGGALHDHPDGTRAGAQAFINAINKV